MTQSPMESRGTRHVSCDGEKSQFSELKLAVYPNETQTQYVSLRLPAPHPGKSIPGSATATHTSSFCP
ncbi:hypothetical protein [Photorhabdus caribbeanensis]|uniref:hypothetical protein n=1 Tax=Photorhabdus caribbeanensis TaxID=1004165 RepID=UPI001BD67B09|nr:hypothetical protein [Photorhabdus caribbeanensis]